RRDFQTQDPVLDSIGIHLHSDGFLWFLFRFRRAWARLRLFFFSFFGLLFFAFFLGFADFIALRRERIRGVLGERDKVNPLHVAIDICEFLVAKLRFEIARRTKQ